MADEAPPSGTPPQGTPAPVAATPPAQAASSDEPAAPSHRDWNGLQQSLREIAKGLGALSAAKTTAPAAAQPAATAAAAVPNDQIAALAAEVASLRAESAITRALDAEGITDPKQRAALTSLGRAAAPPDFAAWVKETKENLGLGRATTPAASAANPVALPSPAAPGAQTEPKTFWDTPAEVLAAMKPDELKAKFEKEKRAGLGTFQNPHISNPRPHERRK